MILAHDPCLRQNPVQVGLGVVLKEQSFFHKNERNHQEQSHRSKIKRNVKNVKKNI